MKKGTKVKFPVEGTGRNHFGIFLGKEKGKPENAIIDCPALSHFEGDQLCYIAFKDLVECEEVDKMEEAREELNYLLRTSSEVGIAPQFRKKIVEIIHLLNGKTDKEQGYKWGKD